MDEITRRAWSAAVEASYLAFYRAACAPMPAAELREDAESFMVLTGLPLPIANVVARVDWGTPLAPEAARARIEATLAPFKARGVPCLWTVWPSTRPANLAEELEAYGLAHAGDPPAMALDLAGRSADVPAVPGLRIHTVADAATHDRWIATMAAGFGFTEAEAALFRTLGAVLGHGPPFYQFLAYLGAEPVATATLVPSTGVAGIYNVATLPEARGQGIGAAMTATVLRAGRDLGCHTAILIASELGEPVYRRVGFEECCRVGEYVWQPDSSAG